jgi:hypothetical protein
LRKKACTTGSSIAVATEGYLINPLAKGSASQAAEKLVAAGRNCRSLGLKPLGMTRIGGELLPISPVCSVTHLHGLYPL